MMSTERSGIEADFGFITPGQGGGGSGLTREGHRDTKPDTGIGDAGSANIGPYNGDIKKGVAI